MLGRKPVIHRNRHAAPRVRQHPAWLVGHIDIADDPSAAMKIHEHAERPVAFGHVDANGYFAARPWNRAILDVRHRLRLALRRPPGGPPLPRRELMTRL